MTTTSNVSPATQKPEYKLKEGKIVRTQAAADVERAYNEAKVANDLLAETYVGAMIAQMFVLYPWLDRVHISLTASSVSSDHGDYFRNISGSVSDVTALEGAQIPEDLLDSSGNFNPDMAIDLLEEQWVREGFETEVYAALCEASDYDDLELHLDRSKVAHLLDTEEIGGHEAFVLLLPELASGAEKVSQVADETEAQPA